MAKTSPQSDNGIVHPHIERRPGVSAGKPVIVGTRIRVTQIALEHERLGWSADQIIDAHPHLTLAQVHAALSYYYDHQTELDADMNAARQAATELRDRYPSKVAALDASPNLHE